MQPLPLNKPQTLPKEKKLKPRITPANADFSYFSTYMQATGSAEEDSARGKTL